MKRFLLLWMIALIGVRSEISYSGGSSPLRNESCGGITCTTCGVSSDGTLFSRPPEDVGLSFHSEFEANFAEFFDAATTAAHYDITNRTEKEKKLVEQNIFIQPNTPASFHLNLFQSTPETIAFGARGMLDLQKSFHLATQYSSSFQANNLTVEQGFFALSNVLTSFASSSAQLLSGDSQPADTCPYDEVQCPNSNSTFRTINGSCNNLKNPSWGMTNTALHRLNPPKYSNGVDSPRRAESGLELPSTRLISQQLTDFGISGHTESEISTLMLMQWGQFLTHDNLMTPQPRLVNHETGQLEGILCCQNGQVIEESLRHPDCLPITIPENDAFFAQHNQRCMNFVRSLPAVRPQCMPGPREQQNALTAFIDGSQIYGTNDAEALELRGVREVREERRVRGVHARMKIQRSEHHDVLLPPQNRLLLPQQTCDSEKQCFAAGDRRVHEQPQLAVAHTIWVREHNRIVNELLELNPDWDDERLYQESRRIVGAEIQQITYNEYFPILLGDAFMSAFKLKSGIGSKATNLYDETMNPSITNEFAAAAFRMGHSMVQGTIKGFDKDDVQSHHLVFHEQHFKPDLLYEDNGVETLVRGLLTQPSQKVDRVFTEEVRNHLFQRNQNFGMDLVALNIQRGRDHGLPPYNDYRECCGRPRAQRWEDFLDVLDPCVVEGMKKIYGHPDDVDLYLGGVSERPVEGAILGPTFSCLVGDQAVRLRRGDRFFFEEATAGFTPKQLASLRQVTLARILCDNSRDVESVQPWAFFNSDFQENLRTPCNGTMIPKLNLTLWQE